MSIVKIKDREMVRDLNTNAVLNVNTTELDSFNKRRNIIMTEKREKEETKQRLIKIEQDMQIIQSLLSEILQLRASNGN